MAFTEKKLPYARIDQFMFFADDSVLNAEATETFEPDFDFEVEKIRLHLSTAHVSIEDFTVTINNLLGSVYNANLLSQAMVGVQDVLLQFNPTLKLFLSDTINFSLIMSATNSYGIEISGWSITVPAR